MTWITGEVITESLLNAHVRDNESYLKLAYGTRMNRNGTAQTISDPGGGSWTALQWTTAAYNDGPIWASGSNTRLTAPVAGYWVYSFNGVWAATSATGVRAARMKKNGAVVDQDNKAGATTYNVTHQLVFHDRSAANDYYEVEVFQTSTANLDIDGGTANTHFAAGILQPYP